MTSHFMKTSHVLVTHVWAASRRAPLCPLCPLCPGLFHEPVRCTDQGPRARRVPNGRRSRASALGPRCPVQRRPARGPWRRLSPEGGPGGVPPKRSPRGSPPRPLFPSASARPVSGVPPGALPSPPGSSRGLPAAPQSGPRHSEPPSARGSLHRWWPPFRPGWG